MKNLLFALLCFIFVGCETTNPYNNYYTPVNSYQQDSLIDQRIVLFLQENEEPILISVNDSSLEETVKNYHRNGFVLIGQSNFKGEYFDKKFAISKAKEIGATLIIHYTKYNKDITYKKKVQLPNYSTTSQYSNTNANTYGNANVNLYNNTAKGYNTYGNIYGSNNTYANTNSNSYTSGYKTELVDAQYSEYEQGAGYYVKVRNEFIKFGVFPIEVPEEIKNTLQTNKGFCVGTVIRQSPAYMYDILEGDIIINANGKGIYSFDSFLEEYKGKKVELEIFRNGEYIKKFVTLNP